MCATLYIQSREVCIYFSRIIFEWKHWIRHMCYCNICCWYLCSLSIECWYLCSLSIEHQLIIWIRFKVNIFSNMCSFLIFFVNKKIIFIDITGSSVLACFTIVFLSIQVLCDAHKQENQWGFEFVAANGYVISQKIYNSIKKLL